MDTIHALIIDDDAYNIYVMERLLDKENISYTAIRDLSGLVQLLQEEKTINIVFLDLEMPNKDGYEVIKILKKYLNPQIPIIACTVHTAEVNRARKIGFSGFIAKPLDLDRFPDQVERILKGETVWEAH